VAVINATKLPDDSNRRLAAVQHIIACLEPHGDITGEKPGYSLVVYFGEKGDKSPLGMLRWMATVYSSLPRALRKGVKVIALVNPGMFVSGTVSALMPLVSSKAYKKVVKVSGGLDALGYKAGIATVSLGVPFLHSIGRA